MTRSVIRLWQRLRPFTRRLHCQRGQDAVEYVLLAVLVALAVTAGMVTLTTALDGSYTSAAKCIANPTFGSSGKGGGTGAPGGGQGQGNGPTPGNCPTP